MNLLLISVKSDVAAGGIAVWTDYFLSHCHQNGITCHLVNTEIIGRRTYTIRRRLWDEVVRTLRIWRDLKRQLKSHRYDAVYLNTSCGTYGLFRDTYLARLVRRRGIPLITHYHCEIPYWVKRPLSIRCLGRLARMSTHNLVLCRNSHRFLEEHYGISSRKVPNFIHSRLLTETPPTPLGDIAEVVFVGQVTETKGAAELYEVARQLPTVHFTFIGDVSRTVAAWDKPTNVTLTGRLPHPQVIDRLDHSDLFLLPSHTEGCSLALMEAMARGLPAIATDTGANAEMLDDGCGVVVEPQNVEAMMAAIRRLNDATLRREMGTKAVQRIRERYTNANVDILFQIADDAVQSH